MSSTTNHDDSIEVISCPANDQVQNDLYSLYGGCQRNNGHMDYDLSDHSLNRSSSNPQHSTINKKKNRHRKESRHSNSRASSSTSGYYRPTSTVILTDNCPECSTNGTVNTPNSHYAAITINGGDNSLIPTTHPEILASKLIVYEEENRTFLNEFPNTNRDKYCSNNIGNNNAKKLERTPKEKQVARMICIVATAMILTSFVLVGVTLSMTDHIDEMVRKMSSTTTARPLIQSRSETKTVHKNAVIKTDDSYNSTKN